MFVLLAACDSGVPSGGAASPPPVSSSGTLTLAVDDLSDVPPTTTFVPGLADVMRVSVAVGDFDGNGIADIALPTTAGVEIWFGPLPAGDLEIGTGPVLLTAGGVPDSGGIGLAADFDGDGTDELAVGPSLVKVPTTPGTFASEDFALATFPTGAVPSGMAFDADGDGVVDVLVDQTSWLSIAYGPLTGIVALPGAWSEVPGPAVGMIRGAEDLQFGTWPTRAFLPDVDANGKPEILLGNYGYDVYGDTADDDNFIVELGDLRGRVVEQTSAIVAGLPRLASFGDLDGDGLAEVGDDYNVYRASDLVVGRTLPEPLATSVEQAFASNPWIDLDGDGLREVALFGGARIAAAASLRGTIDRWSAGVSLDPTAFSPSASADLDGDDVPDLVFTGGESQVRVYSGADLRDRWVNANNP